MYLYTANEAHKSANARVSTDLSPEAVIKHQNFLPFPSIDSNFKNITPPAS